VLADPGRSLAGRSQTFSRTAALLLLSVVAIAASGCANKRPTSPAAMRLERNDLIAVSHALKSVKDPVAAEVAATKAAWPLIVDGLPVDTTTVARPPLLAATGAAARLTVPTFFEEAHAATLTGPGSELAGLFRSFGALAIRGWQMIGSSVEEIEHGSPVAATFARANVALYIESVYDAHFTLAQVGKTLLDAYKKLRGPAAFGAALTQAEVDALAQSYSEPSDRLHPHVGVRLGS
jgi:hypothetical protein